jgi:hypothetical protein
MTHFDLTTAIGTLRDVGDDIRREWEETKPYWNDEDSRNIEQNHLQPFLLELQNAMTAMQRIAELAQQAKRDCLPEND